MACRMRAALGRIWMPWRLGMLFAGMRCGLKLLLDVGPLVIPMQKKENQAG